MVILSLWRVDVIAMDYAAKLQRLIVKNCTTVSALNLRRYSILAVALEKRRSGQIGLLKCFVEMTLVEETNMQCRFGYAFAIE